MNELSVDPLPLIFGATLVPIYPIIVLLLLQSERGLGRASPLWPERSIVRPYKGRSSALSLPRRLTRRAAPVLCSSARTLLTIVGILCL